MSRIAAALGQKNMGPKALAAVLGVSEKTAWNKMNGQTEFTMTEAIKTKRVLLKEYDLEYLFGDLVEDTVASDGQMSGQ